MAEKKKIKITTENDDPVNEDTHTGEALNVEEAAKESEDGQKELIQADDPLADLKTKLQSKEDEAKENYDRLLRVSAEFENYKKRLAREMEDLRKFANQALLKEMLSVVDNLELAINSSTCTQDLEKSLVAGLDMTHKELLRVFEKFDVKPIEAKGKPFDPAFHEAVTQEETDEYPENTVMNELQRGYLIHDRLLRPAMVVVAKPKPNNTQEESKPKKEKK
ncbi:MAG: nucleotide exchange factor GrpE [Desulfobacterales bacterium]|nr:MAG: nucleotide exchange factor GrpE [Desulfobacterales bacterium]